MIRMNIATFPVAFPSKTVASNGGVHLYNLQHDTESWNGAVVAKGDYVSLDLYDEGTAGAINAKIVDVAANGNFYVEIQETVPATQALIVYNVPMIEEEYNKNFQKESNYFIDVTEEERAYPLCEGDIWELSKENFVGTPVVGATITSVSDKKWVIATA